MKHTRPTQPWEQIMREMVMAVQYVRSFERVNYRMAAARVAAPSVKTYNQHSDIIFAIDVSGSMSDKTVGNIINEVLSLSQTTEIKNMRILYWDAGVTADIFVEDGMMMNSKKGCFNFIGGGGTNINCVYNYIVDKEYEPSGVCYLTDGYIDGDKFYTGETGECINAVLITKNGSPHDMEKVKSNNPQANITIYQTDL